MPHQINSNCSARGKRNLHAPISSLALLWLCAYGAVLAQKPLLLRYDVADGLANSVVTSIYQDKKVLSGLGRGKA